MAMRDRTTYSRATSLALIALLLGMTASFSLPADPVPDLQPDEKPLHTVASMGYFHGSDSGSIYTNTTLTVAGSSTCAVAQDGSLRCWGSNTWGQTGLWPFENNPTLSPSWLVQHHSPSSTWNQTWTEVEGDNQHYCGITDNKDMYCWGSGRWGQLGVGDTNWENTEPRKTIFADDRETIQVAPATLHTCSISPMRNSTPDHQSVFCWGNNGAGQLGTAGGPDSSNPTRALLPQGSVPVGIASSWEHTCATLSNGTGLCWGNNSHGQLGDISLAERNTPTPVRLVPAGRYIVQMSTGVAHTCALLDDGSIACWGDNQVGQLGNGTTSSSWQASSVVSLPSGKTAISIDVKYGSACAILNDDSLVCWGSNSRGQVDPSGGGDSYIDGDPVWTTPNAVNLPGNPSIATVSIGFDHACAITTTSDLYCWGANNIGQLGTGGATSIPNQLHPVNLGPSADPSNPTAPNQPPALSDRDPDHDGILSLFDSNPMQSDCQPGYYNLNSSNTGCYPASPGYYVGSTSMTEQSPCPSGTFQPLAAQTECLDAQPGHYTNVTEAATLQLPCPPGTYQPSLGQFAETTNGSIPDICLQVTPGHYSDTGSSMEVPCPPGTYQTGFGNSFCEVTDPGYYAPGSGNVDQTPCESGTYQPSMGQSSCFSASPGYSSPIGSSQQEPCQPGTYSDEFSLGECKLADPGYYVEGHMSTNQEACLPGQYQPAYGQTSCVSTTPGHYTSDSGSANQIACEPGTFEPQHGAISCSGVAQSGHYSPSGSADQIECLPGAYAPYNGLGECILSDPGSHVPLNASLDQIPCPPGQYQPNSGQSTCLSAEPGHYSEGGATEQVACHPGSFQSQSEATSCELAQPGNRVNQYGATEQTPCEPGEYQDVPGALICMPADQGTYSDLSGLTEPTPCPSGTYQPLTGQTECILADKGHYVPEIGAISQSICDRGTYQYETGQSECLEAAPGYYVPNTGQTSQDPCLPGSFQPVSGAVGCISAEPEHFVSEPASISQTPCPSGETQSQYGQTSCEEGTQLVMIAGGVGAVVVLLMIMFMQSQKKPKKGSKRRTEIQRPRRLNVVSEEE